MARILLIDDDEALRNVLSLALTHHGHTVIEAGDGKQGLAQFKQGNIDLVITDIVMPEKEGLEVLMKLVKKHPLVKIIAISGGGGLRSADYYLRMAKLIGATKVIPKPFSGEVLMAAINELLPSGEAPVR